MSTLSTKTILLFNKIITIFPVGFFVMLIYYDDNFQNNDQVVKLLNIIYIFLLVQYSELHKLDFHMLAHAY